MGFNEIKNRLRDLPITDIGDIKDASEAIKGLSEALKKYASSVSILGEVYEIIIRSAEEDQK